jgi:hypothetical protein
MAGQRFEHDLLHLVDGDQHMRLLDAIALAGKFGLL